jgi:hypothetical protein
VFRYVSGYLVMALTLIRETGALVANANSYASVADCDSYHDGHLYASAWTGATTATKEAALVMATRLIDGCYQFNGFKVSSAQSLQWPREACLNPDMAPSSTNAFFAADAVPVVVVNATCEVARELIKADTTDATDGEGLQSISIAGAMSIQFDKRDQQAKIPETARLFLARLGTYLAQSSGMVRLTRV